MKNPATTSEEDENQGIKEHRHNPENCLDRVYQYRIHRDKLKLPPCLFGQRQRQGSMGAGRRTFGDKSNSTTKCKTQESGGKKA
jgi:hypothetical protein